MAKKMAIIGGGIHGVHIANSFISAGIFDLHEICIVDPHGSLLENWRNLTSRVGMSHLRSPSVHNLAVNPNDLKRTFRNKRRHFAFPYSRPRLEVFNKHSIAIVEDLGLSSVHLQGTVEQIKPVGDFFRIQLTSLVEFFCENLIFAIGNGIDHHNIPAWAEKYVHSEESAVRHIFSSNFEMGDSESVTIVGGGMTASQYAVQCANQGREVHLVMRRKLKIHHFDSDPCWLGPKCLVAYERNKSLSARRVMISRARNLGSVNPAVKSSLDRLVNAGKIKVCVGEVDNVVKKDGLFHYSVNEKGYSTKQMILATGFKKARPGGNLIDHFVSDYDLPLSPCGYPVVDENLKWAKGVFVSGSLAELELGPAAKNISGARMAARRIVSYFASRSNEKPDLNYRLRIPYGGEKELGSFS